MITSEIQPKNASLCFEGFRCFWRSLRGWIGWALIVMLLETITAFSVWKWHLESSTNILEYILSIISLSLFAIFFLRQETIFGSINFCREHILTGLRCTLQIFFKTLPALLGAWLAASAPYIFIHLLGLSQLEQGHLNDVLLFLQTVGLVILVGIEAYFLFRVIQIFALSSSGVAQPLRVADMLNKGNWLRLFWNFIPTILVPFFLTWIFGTIYWLTTRKLSAGISYSEDQFIIFIFLMELPLIASSIISTGIIVAFACAANRVFYEEKLRSDPDFRLMFNNPEPESEVLYQERQATEQQHET